MSLKNSSLNASRKGLLVEWLCLEGTFARR